MRLTLRSRRALRRGRWPHRADFQVAPLHLELPLNHNRAALHLWILQRTERLFFGKQTQPQPRHLSKLLFGRIFRYHRLNPSHLKLPALLPDPNREEGIGLLD